jgi:hypothetical protein
VHFIPAFLNYWRARRNEPDFDAAIQGLGAGIAHHGEVDLDINAAYYRFDENGQSAPVNLAVDFIAVDLLTSEEERITALGYRNAPVWDYSEKHWTGNARRTAFHSCVRQLIERGVRQCHISGPNTSAARQMIGLMKLWGLPQSDRDVTLPSISWRYDDKLVLTDVDGTREFISPEVIVSHSGHISLAEMLVVRLRQKNVSAILIYGAGEIGQALAAAVRREHIQVKAYLETAPQSGTASDGIPVLSAAAGLAQWPGVDVVVASLGSAPVMSKNLFEVEPELRRPVWFVR